MEILACVFFSCSRMSYSISTGPSYGLDGPACSGGGTIRFDNLSPLVIGAAASSALFCLFGSSFLLTMMCGKVKIGSLCVGLPSSGRFVDLADCPADVRKIEDGGATAVGNIGVFFEPCALKIGSWPDGGLAVLNIGETEGDCGLGPHSDDLLHGGSCELSFSLSRRVAIWGSGNLNL